MTDERDQVWRRAEPDSPCQAICLIDPATRHCIGCNRTSDEISNWTRMTADQRAALRAELPTRKPGGAKRKGGRARRVSERKDSGDSG